MKIIAKLLILGFLTSAVMAGGVNMGLLKNYDLGKKGVSARGNLVGDTFYFVYDGMDTVPVAYQAYPDQVKKAVTRSVCNNRLLLTILENRGKVVYLYTGKKKTLVVEINSCK